MFLVKAATWREKRIGNDGNFHIAGAAGASQETRTAAATFVFTKLPLPVNLE